MKPLDILMDVAELVRLPDVRNSSADPLWFAARMRGETKWRIAQFWAWGATSPAFSLGGPEHDSPGALMRGLAIRWSGPDELLSPYREMQAGGE